MPTKYTSTLLWADVPADQRETPARDARTLLDLAQPMDRRDAIEAEILRPVFRESIRRWQRSEQQPRCPMATRQWYSPKIRGWMYRPCGNPPKAGEQFCWRHVGATKTPGH